MSGVNIRNVKSSPTPERARYHHGDLRNALLETALRLVARNGPEGFSLREAARELDVSAAAAYRHFADKAALLAALSTEGHARLATAMEEAITRVESRPGTKAHAVGALGAIGEAYVEFAVRHPSHFRVMFGPCQEEDGIVPGCASSGRDAFQILLDVLDELVAAGVIPARNRPGAEIAAWALVHGLAGLLVEGVLPLAPKERTAAFRGAARTLLLGLGCDPALVPTTTPVIIDPRASEGHEPAAKKAT